MHKGYAFVQFTNPFDARNACLGEDGRNILSQTLGKLLRSPRPKSTSFTLNRQRMAYGSQAATAFIFWESSCYFNFLNCLDYDRKALCSWVIGIRWLSRAACLPAAMRKWHRDSMRRRNSETGRPRAGIVINRIESRVACKELSVENIAINLTNIMCNVLRKIDHNRKLQLLPVIVLLITFRQSQIILLLLSKLAPCRKLSF